MQPRPEPHDASSSLTHADKLNLNHLPPPLSPRQDSRRAQIPKSLFVAINWRRHVVSAAARAASAALFGYLCPRRNEFQLEYQAPCTPSCTHAQAELLSNSVGLIWVYLFLKKANGGAMCTVLQRNSLHFNTLFFFRSSERMFSSRQRRSLHFVLERLTLFFSLPSFETETIHRCRLLSRVF